MAKWRLLDTGVSSAADNMALDEVLMVSRSRNLAPDTVRFLQFSPPAVLVGYHQSVDQEVRVDFCKRQGIDINRRWTGGGAIFFDSSQLGWEVIASKEDPAIPESIAALFQKMSMALIDGLGRLGVVASFRPRNDIEVRGRKISGLGGTELDGAILFQGTLLVDFDVDTMLRALRIPVEKLIDKEVRSLRERITCLREELGYRPPLTEIKEALEGGFAATLGIDLERGGLTEDEQDLFQDRRGFYAQDEWRYQTSQPLGVQEVLRSTHKAKGGIIRIALMVEGDRIRTALIAGDFFVYPQRAVLDLEASLKDVYADREALRETVYRFFQKNNPIFPGIEASDFVEAMGEALDKRTYIQYGISPTEAGHIFTVNKPLAEMPPCSVMLLPYCSKLTDCTWRKEDGCDECGLCTIGDAYRVARESALTPISILNYEHLQQTLEKCKADGVRAYIGSCCEAFYVRHRDDLERAGLPGVLVDVHSTTCYELGENDLAYEGRFERQTHLNMGLLQKVVNIVAPKENRAVARV